MEVYMSSEKIAILTHVDKNFKAIDNLVDDNRTSYAKTNNHEYIKVSTEEVIQEKPINNELYWVKIIATLETLKKRKDIDWLLMLDLDIIFNNHNIPLSFFTNCANPKHELLMCAMESNMIKNYWNVNIGSIFFKNTEYVVHFLEEFLNIGKNFNFIHFEQPVLQTILKNNSMSILEKTGFFPEHAFNHGNEKTFLHHAMSSSTSNSNFEEAVDAKIKQLSRALNKNE